MTAAPYGANKKMDEWAKLNGLRYSPNAHCLHWIARGPCGVALCDDGHDSGHWMDHVFGGIGNNGERLLICQPYNFHDFLSLERACEDFALKASVSGRGWYEVAMQ